MDMVYVKRCVNGKTFAASADSGFEGLEGRKCPYTGGEFEPQVKEVHVDNAEIMGIDYEELVAGVQKESIFFGKFRISLGETMIM